ncbi:glycosyltransferase family 21 protein [Vararia minispora EC-137]|uniref:Glycosyltransferase family 21 protein n=1 Tax=Vararia minispora EC-137 TaxID=1314806 RepID=A0ACB8QFW6_9AGAM|nr:glycosyltransferase family 21 protein [Vararia minispora EC-137]
MVNSTVAFIGLLWYGIIWSICLLGCCAARKRYRLRPRSPLASAPSSQAPGVSVLRPLKGLDANLYENLESSFTQEYSNFELLLCVDGDHDQALPVVEELLRKYPHVNARVVISNEDVGVNPKVNNLIQAYREAAHDILWVLDSNITVDPGTLARSVDALNKPVSPGKKRIGLVHHVPFAFSNQSTLGARLEEAFLNTNHAKMYIAINTVAVDSCVMGKSNLYRRSELELVNGHLKRRRDPHEDNERGFGLAAFGRFLAEDNMIAAALWHELDLRHDLSCDVAQNAIGSMSFSDYIWRRVRWIRVRKIMSLAATLVEPFTECIIVSLIAVTCLRALFGRVAFLILPIHYVLWIWVDLDVYESLAGYPLLPSKRLAFLSAWIMREFLALPIWILAMLGNTVSWRGKRYRIFRSGEVGNAENGKPLSQWFRFGRRATMEREEARQELLSAQPLT